MRNSGGTYTLQFSESLKEDEFLIAPTMDFQVSHTLVLFLPIMGTHVNVQVNVQILGGLMALGYSIVVIIHRRSIVLGGHEELSVTLDTLEGKFLYFLSFASNPNHVALCAELGAQTFTQIKGSSRQLVAQVGEKLGLTGTFITKSYIEIYLDKFPTATPPNGFPLSSASNSSSDSQLDNFVNAKL